jgi:predicted nucleic acid-binding Zn ribbon protein
MVENPPRRCPGCRSRIPDGVALCPTCGTPLSTNAAVRKPNRRALVLLGGLLLAMVVALAVRRLTTSPGSSPCHGGQDPRVEWRTTDPRPTFIPGELFQIDPSSVPFRKLAEIRTTGNRTYGDKCDNEWGHFHDPVTAAVVREGANAFFNSPAQHLDDDRVEVVVTAVLARAPTIPREIRDRYFPEGRALMIVRIFPGSVAEAAGLRPADLVAELKGVPLRTGRHAQLAAIPVVADEAADAVVIRDGRAVTVSMVRRGTDKFGFNDGEVPILEVSP